MRSANCSTTAVVDEVPGARHDRSRAAGVHARTHALRRVRDSRRSAERDARAAEDVPHAPGRGLEDGRQRRRHADRSAARGARSGLLEAPRRFAGIDDIGDRRTERRPTSCAIRWSRRSSRVRAQTADVYFATTTRRSGVDARALERIARSVCSRRRRARRRRSRSRSSATRDPRRSTASIAAKTNRPTC